MLAGLRTLAKRILPQSMRSAWAKSVWERIKRRQDKARFNASFPNVPYVYFSKSEISAIRANGYFGQICQDYFLDLLFEREKGQFLDIGANNPQANSNTWYFEQKGWTGYAFDPMRSLRDKWTGRTGTTFINAGISNREETRRFVEILPRVGWEHQLSSFREFVRDEDMRLHDYIEYDVPCAPIAHFVPDSEVIDFASIDVEGAEGLILDGFDFDTTPPRAIVLENVAEIGGIDAHRRTLIDAGYQLIARIHASDDLFVHKGLKVSERLRKALERYSV